MGDELTIKELYGTLKDSAKKNEVHLVSFTSKNINHYLIKDYDEKTLLNINNKNALDDILFIDTANTGSLGKTLKPEQTSLRNYMSKNNFRKKDEDGEIVFIYGSNSGLPQIFAMHNNVLGPGIGGLRENDYKREHGKFYLDSMITNCLRLAKSMTSKGAINETHSGGGKATRYNNRLTTEERKDKTILDKFNEKRKHANFELAISLNVINGFRIERGVNPYYTAKDMNTKCADFDQMFSEGPKTNYVVSKSLEIGGTGNPSPYTAIGTISSMIEGAKRVFGVHENSLEGRVVLLEGVGNCGREVLKYLVHNNAKVIATDIAKFSIERAIKELGDHADKVKFVFYDQKQLKKDKYLFIKENKGDIYSPCALGETLNEITSELLYKNGVRLIAGSANEQFVDDRIDRHPQLFHRTGILTLPDYVVNRAGLINARQELPDIIHRTDNMVDLARETSNILARILDISTKEDISPFQAVQRIVDKRLEYAENRV
ncbi:hypothetical protein KY313_01785 [Candidatus Woesearchaeota archaeon]|nr:hypothetical protein [Candidatus Woesearchaeota archaeon]